MLAMGRPTGAEAAPAGSWVTWPRVGPMVASVGP